MHPGRNASGFGLRTSFGPAGKLGSAEGRDPPGAIATPPAPLTPTHDSPQPERCPRPCISGGKAAGDLCTTQLPGQRTIFIDNPSPGPAASSTRFFPGVNSLPALGKTDLSPKTARALLLVVVFIRKTVN